MVTLILFWIYIVISFILAFVQYRIDNNLFYALLTLIFWPFLIIALILGFIALTIYAFCNKNNNGNIY